MSVFAWEFMIDGCTTSVIFFGDKYTFGLVVDDNGQLITFFDRSAFDRDMVTLFYLVAEIFDDLFVERHFSLFDEFVGFPSRVFCMM